MTGVSAAIPLVVPSEWRAGWKADAVLKHKTSATMLETIFIPFFFFKKKKKKGVRSVQLKPVRVHARHVDSSNLVF